MFKLSSLLTTAVVAVAAFGMAQTASADTIVDYQMGGQAPTVVSPDASASDMTSSAVTGKGGDIDDNFNSMLTSGSANEMAGDTDSDSPHYRFADGTGGGVTPDNFYLEFTITPNTGFAFNLSELSLFAGQLNVSDVDTEVLYDIGGLGTFVSAGPAQDAGLRFDSPGDQAAAFNQFDLSGIAALQGVTQSVTFRLDADGSDGMYYFADDVKVTGTVVPEPASLALLGLGGVMVLAGRRRHA